MKCTSRYDDPGEIEEMRKARVELEYKGLLREITELFYDSQACLCSVVLRDEENCEWWLIRDVLEHHISQFELHGSVSGKDFLHAPIGKSE